MEEYHDDGDDGSRMLVSRYLSTSQRISVGKKGLVKGNENRLPPVPRNL